MLIKSLFFYVVITLEAFIFCYAGEYLSAKVRMMELQILSLRIQYFFFVHFLYYSTVKP